MKIKKEYTRDGVTIIWQPDLCTHSGVCVHRLSSVFKPRERPWIQMENADMKAITETVRACPSGAISIKNAAPPPLLSIEPMEGGNNKITVITNGPVKVSGPCRITMPDGETVEKPNGISLCRCGKSTRLPLCDGSHKGNGFVG